MTVRNAVATVEQPGAGALVQSKQADFALVLPSHLKPEQWTRVAMGVVRRDKNLQRVAKANPGSLLSALLTCAHLGLEPGDTFHLVPFGNEVVGITDYTGEIELIYRAGAIAKVEAQVVYANDRFDYRPGEMDRPLHEADWFGDRGEMIGVYAYGVFHTGAVSRVVIMSRAEVEQVREVSKTKDKADSPWKRWPDRMWLKTVVKQLRKWVPSSAEYRSEVLRSEAAVEQTNFTQSAEDYYDLNDDDDVQDAEIVEETGEIVPSDG